MRLYIKFVNKGIKVKAKQNSDTDEVNLLIEKEDLELYKKIEIGSKIKI
jgi:hypothetical protein